MNIFYWPAFSRTTKQSASFQTQSSLPAAQRFPNAAACFFVPPTVLNPMGPVRDETSSCTWRFALPQLLVSLPAVVIEQSGSVYCSTRNWLSKLTPSFDRIGSVHKKLFIITRKMFPVVLPNLSNFKLTRQSFFTIKHASQIILKRSRYSQHTFRCAHTQVHRSQKAPHVVSNKYCRVQQYSLRPHHRLNGKHFVSRSRGRGEYCSGKLNV